MVTVYQVVYENQRPVLKRLEKIYGPINLSLNDTVEPEYDPIFDDPEFQELDKLMRQVPRKGDGS